MSRAFTEQKASGFAAPAARPRDAEQRRAWHDANRAWWESHPMRYDWNASIPHPPETRAWYEEVDRRFLSASVVPQRERPFDTLIPFAQLPQMSVLEIGVGMGCHAQLLASAAGSFVGIDLTAAAVAATRRRLEICGLRKPILQMNAEQLSFPDSSFDLVWSWGVIHHAADTAAVLREIHRVLKPGGRAGIMVYHRAFVPWYIYDGLCRGVLLGGLRRHGSLHGVVQSITDGALARYYSRKEWRALVAPLFHVERLETYGNRAEALPLPAGRMKEALLAALPDPVLRAWLTGLHQGRLLFSSLVSRK